MITLLFLEEPFLDTRVSGVNTYWIISNRRYAASWSWGTVVTNSEEITVFS